MEPHRDFRAILEDSSIDPVVVYYWGYMYDLSNDYMLDYLERHGISFPQTRVIEIGAAEGGNLCAMAERNALELVGTDIAEERLRSARTIARVLDLDITYTSNDIIYQEQPPEWVGHFDLALLRDVIEHLDDAETALRNIGKLLRPGGTLYVTFPPWYSPFGGHQQLLVNGASRIPWVHLLPGPLFERAIASGRANDVVEVRRLREIRMTTTKFRRAARGAGYEIEDERLFLIRPVFRSKFGLPPIGANLLRPIPGLRDMLALEAGYVLRKRENDCTETTQRTEKK